MSKQGVYLTQSGSYGRYKMLESIISETSASDFFQEYLGNEAAKLIELIENLTREEKETPF